jgi:hypothetical protein
MGWEDMGIYFWSVDDWVVGKGEMTGEEARPAKKNMRQGNKLSLAAESF